MNTVSNNTAYTALVPMGGKCEGLIALHSAGTHSLEAARAWANGRFSNPENVVIVKDQDHPWLYGNNFESENDPKLIEFRNRVKALYNSLKS